jgi:hypothetical protein
MIHVRVSQRNKTIETKDNQFTLDKNNFTCTVSKALTLTTYIIGHYLDLTDVETLARSNKIGVVGTESGYM